MRIERGQGYGYAFLRGLIGHVGDACIQWPLCRDNHGYGQLGHEQVSYKAHKLLCEMIHGPAPSKDHQASHTCNKGHEGCVNPNHIIWETRRDNHLRRRENGTAATNKHGPTGKTSLLDACLILALEGVVTQETLADRFGISKPTVRNIFKGKTRVARKAMAFA